MNAPAVQVSVDTSRHGGLIARCTASDWAHWFADGVDEAALHEAVARHAATHQNTGERQ